MRSLMRDYWRKDRDHARRQIIRIVDRFRITNDPDWLELAEGWISAHGTAVEQLEAMDRNEEVGKAMTGKQIQSGRVDGIARRNRARATTVASVGRSYSTPGIHGPSAGHAPMVRNRTT